MPRGYDSRHDERRQPPVEWRPREVQTATVEQGMEARAWKYLGKRDEDDTG